MAKRSKKEERLILELKRRPKVDNPFALARWILNHPPPRKKKRRHSTLGIAGLKRHESELLDLSTLRRTL